MAKVEFDNKGRPQAFITSNNVVGLITEEGESLPIVTTGLEVEPVDAGSFKVIPWYDNNDFPQEADKTISDTSVLKRALSDLSKATLGQGVFPCEVLDTLPNGQEELKMISDPVILKQLQSYVIRRYLAKTCYDKNAMGSAFVQLMPNLEGTKIVALNPVNALKCRLEYNKDGAPLRVIVSGKWPDVDKKSVTAYTLLDEIDPFAHLIQLRDEGLLKKESVFMHIKNSFSSNDYYPMPDWYAAKKWISITQKVPKIIDAGIDNVLNIFFVIRIPASYWDWKYPEDEYESRKERMAIIQADIEMLEEKFTTPENAKKALITHFGNDESGLEDKWEIEILQAKFSQENFVTSNAADTQIAIAAGYSPDLLGLMYGNSKGGSMQRELLLLQYALSWESRQQLAEPIEMMLKFNNPGMENLQLRFRNTFLTTLDSGSGTESQLS